MVLEVTRASVYKLLRESLPGTILSEEPFIDNVDGTIIAGYRVKIQYRDPGGIRDLYDYLAGCLDAGLEAIEKDEEERIIFVLRCWNPHALRQLSVETNSYTIIRLDASEVLEKILPRLRNKYVAHKIEAVVRGDREKYHDIVREEVQADEVLRQLAVEEILFSNHRDEYEKILSIRPEEAKFQQRLLKELVGCGR